MKTTIFIMVLLINIKTSSFYFEQKAFLASKYSIRKSAEKIYCWEHREMCESKSKIIKMNEVYSFELIFLQWDLFHWNSIFSLMINSKSFPANSFTENPWLSANLAGFHVQWAQWRLLFIEIFIWSVFSPNQ